MCSQVFEHSATEWRAEWEKSVCIQGHCNVYGVTVSSYEAGICVCVVCVSTYQTSWCHIPEECNARCHHHVNLKSHNYFIFTPVNFTMCQQCTFNLHTLQHWKRDACYMTVYLEHSGLLWCDNVPSHRWCWLLKASTNTRALPSFEMSKTTRPMSHHHTPDHLNPQPERCQNLKSWQLHLTQLCKFCMP